MRLKSKGLGKKELVMDFREYTVVREGDELVVVGTIRDPINWDFTIRMCEDDLAGMIALGSNPSVFGLIWRWLFGSKPKHHWGQEREEHLAEGKKRLEHALSVAEEKAVDAMKPSTAPPKRKRRRFFEKVTCPLDSKVYEVRFKVSDGTVVGSKEIVSCSAFKEATNVTCNKECLGDIDNGKENNHC